VEWSNKRFDHRRRDAVRPRRDGGRTGGANTTRFAAVSEIVALSKDRKKADFSHSNRALEPVPQGALAST